MNERMDKDVSGDHFQVNGREREATAKEGATMSSKERRMSRGPGVQKAVSAPKTVVHRDLSALLGAELANEVRLAKQ